MTDIEFHLVQRLTSATHLDEIVDIHGDEGDEYWYDCENNAKMHLREGFEILAESIAYSFQHEGFTDDEADILENLIKRYVPEFVKSEPVND